MFYIDEHYHHVCVYGKWQTLTNKQGQMLKLLIKHAPNIVTKKMMKKEIWTGTYVLDVTINQLIKTLRQVLQDTNKEVIRTVPGLGYFMAYEVQDADDG